MLSGICASVAAPLMSVNAGCVDVKTPCALIEFSHWLPTEDFACAVVEFAFGIFTVRVVPVPIFEASNCVIFVVSVGSTSWKFAPAWNFCRNAPKVFAWSL
jgi:hypothetical protein